MTHHLRLAAACLGWSVLLAGCGASPSASPLTPEPAVWAPAWITLADSNLEPRRFSTAFWTGTEVLVLGGDAGAPACPFEGECAQGPQDVRSDGAAYDPAADTWRPLRPAPVPLWNLSGAILDGVLYLRVIGPNPGAPDAIRFLTYDIAGDRWDEIDRPPGPAGLLLVAAGDGIVGVQPTQEHGFDPDVRFDPANGKWEELPPDPLVPAFDRSAVWTGAELVVLGIPLDPLRPPNRPAVYGAAALALPQLEWQRLPDSEVTGWDPTWFWSGGLILNPATGSADGGQTNGWGRSYPFGGQVTPAGGWLALPAVPRVAGVPRLEGHAAGGEAWALSRSGWALHVPTQEWLPVGLPPGGILEGSAVTWAGDRLFLWGGTRWLGDRPIANGAGWVWSPAGAAAG